MLFRSAAASNSILPTQRDSELVDIARKAMATNISDRYQTVREFQDALRLYQSHHESVILAASAKVHLSKALKDGTSVEFARARFAYEESLKIWPENANAKDGLEKSTIAYATHSLSESDFALGISVLDESNAKHRSLLARLRHGQKQQRKQASRIRNLRLFIYAISAVAIVVMTILLSRERISAASARASRVTAEANAISAMRNAEIAEENQKLAEEASTKASAERIAAIEAETNALISDAAAESARQDSAHDEYRAQISYGNRLIQRGDYKTPRKSIQN